MNGTDPAESRIRSLATRRMILIVVAGPFLTLFAAILLVWKFPDLWVFDFPEEYFFVNGFIILFVCLGLLFLIWRCPECGGYLGKEFRPQRCAKCGIYFDREEQG